MSCYEKIFFKEKNDFILFISDSFLLKKILFL